MNKGERLALILGSVFGAFAGWLLAWTVVFAAPQARPLHELQPPPLSAELVRTSVAISEARRAGIPPDLAVAVSRWEVWNADSLARGRDEEIGYFQITPRYWANTFPECYPDRPLYNPERNACIGTRALRRSFEQTGNWPDALKKYNGSLRLPEAGQRYVKGVERQRVAAAADGTTVNGATP
jgi:soluble lytic murein transglycosylase-like protein